MHLEKSFLAWHDDRPKQAAQFDRALKSLSLGATEAVFLGDWKLETTQEGHGLWDIGCISWNVVLVGSALKAGGPVSLEASNHLCTKKCTSITWGVR